MYSHFKPIHRRVILCFIALIVILCLVVACSRPTYSPAYGVAPAPVYGAAGVPVVQQAPVVVAQPPVVYGGHGHSSAGDAFMGSMAGSMLGNMMSRPNHTVVHSVTTTQPAVRYNPTFNSSPRPPVFATSPRGITTTSRPSWGGGTRISVGRRR